jgi:hypothetical protein
MVYRIAGVYRRRIDEIRPFFDHAEVREEPDETVMLLSPASPGGPGAEIRAMPAGFYVHWYAKKSVGIEDQEQRNTVFANLGRWTEQLYQREMYADFGRKSGDLTVGRFRLVPFAANPALSARLIEEGLDEVRVYRDRVDATIRDKLSKLAAERLTPDQPT